MVDGYEELVQEVVNMDDPNAEAGLMARVCDFYDTLTDQETSAIDPILEGLVGLTEKGEKQLRAYLVDLCFTMRHSSEEFYKTESQWCAENPEDASNLHMLKGEKETLAILASRAHLAERRSNDHAEVKCGPTLLESTAATYSLLHYQFIITSRLALHHAKEFDAQ